MYNIDFNTPVHVHFIGIGGISMSGLADILFSKGFTISGSDMNESALTKKLREKGMTINIGQCAQNITDDIDVVVYTAAIHSDNPEYEAVVAKNIPMLTRAELLGELMANYKVAIGVSGTHGKTTTTSMITDVMLAANLDPTVSVGGILPSINGNLRIGSSDKFITEACEYTDSFLSFSPTIEVILNIEEDHMDFFKDIDDIRLSFKKYASLLPADGLLVINGDIDNASYIYKGLSCKVVTVGSSDNCDYYAANLSYDENGCYSYTLMRNGTPVTEVKLGVTGIHNVYNSLATFAVADALDVPTQTTVDALLTFSGAHRRFQRKGTLNGFTVIDDYAHHPTEIESTLKVASECKHNKVICIFQPHTYTRTNAFLKDFAKALSKVDQLILTDIYAAREVNTLGISSLDLVKEIEQYGTPCIYEPDFDKICDLVKNIASKDDLVITMGAGNVVEIGEKILKDN